MENIRYSMGHCSVLFPNKNSGLTMSIIPAKLIAVSARCVLLMGFYIINEKYSFVECFDEEDQDWTDVVQRIDDSNW